MICVTKHQQLTLSDPRTARPSTFDAFHDSMLDRIAATLGGRVLVICNIPKTSECHAGGEAQREDRLVKGAKE